MIRSLFPDEPPGFPRAVAEADPLIRPKIAVGRTVLNLLIPICGAFVLAYYSKVWIAVVCFAVYVFIRKKDILIWCVRFYQRFAPEYVRRACSFTPTCSEYMILAVEKYGFFKGLRKGVNRMVRCGTESGVDYP
ncbi:MAG: membrane protein insertion efficiency factor YidD [Clostridiales Family XIII bacterium]|nr:membrane protein insertion efficiency factor YidD [Clostridiales Family XIII bacterium]